jgi:hypothetical protein
MSESFRPERPAAPRTLVCRGCGGKLQIIAYLHSQVAIKKILDHFGPLRAEQERPPPEIRCVPVDGEGASW